MHSSWLALCSVVGCTNSCKYCFLQRDCNHINKPVYLASPEKTVDALLKYKYYDESLPICLFPETDIFLNRENIEYLSKTLDELEKRNVQNDLTVVTKCLIPQDMLERLKRVKQNKNLVVYLSYSGLGNEYEPNVNHENIRENFKNLSLLNIPIVHYYRPIIAANANKSKIADMLNYVNNYTDISVINGLMFVPGMTDSDEVWKYLEKYDLEKLKNAVSLWPKDAWEYFYNDYNDKQYIYQTNTCALNTILKRPSLEYYGTFECLNYNHCDPNQRKRCAEYSRKFSKSDILNKLNILLDNLGYHDDYTYMFDDNNGLRLDGIKLDVKTLSYLSHILGIKVYMYGAKSLNGMFNYSFNGSEPLILQKK